MTVEVLEDESRAFGFTVAGVDVDEVGVSGLHDVEAEARKLGVVLLVGRSNPERYETITPLQENAHRMAEATFVLSRRPTTPLPPERTDVDVEVERVGVEGLGSVGALLDPIVRWSGVSQDPRLGTEPARRLLESRIEHLVACGAQLFLGRSEGDVVGFAVLREADRPTIEAMAVRSPGSGQADVVLSAALADHHDAHVESGPVVVGNVPAIRFLERYGFNASRTRYRYHRWLDEEVRR